MSTNGSVPHAASERKLRRSMGTAAAAAVR
jgi:hypothetical protein